MQVLQHSSVTGGVSESLWLPTLQSFFGLLPLSGLDTEGLLRGGRALQALGLNRATQAVSGGGGGGGYEKGLESPHSLEGVRGSSPDFFFKSTSLTMDIAILKPSFHFL